MVTSNSSYQRYYRETHRKQFREYSKRYAQKQMIKQRIKFWRQLQRGQKIRSDFPHYIPDYNIGYILGTITGDGYLYHHPDSSRGAYIIRLRVTSEAFAKEFRNRLAKITEKNLRVIPYIRLVKEKRIQLYRVNCWSKSWLKYFRFLSRYLDRFLARAKPEVLKGFVRGYVDAEGCLRSNKQYGGYAIVLASTKKLDIKCTKIALINLGFWVKGLYQYRTQHGSPLFIIMLSGIYLINKYAREIGFTDSAKQTRAMNLDYKTESLKRRSLRRFKVGS